MDFRVRMLVITVLVGALAGCASTRQSGNIEQLQIRVAQLEREVTEKDETIASLQQRSAVSTIKSHASSKPVAQTDKSGIIRVAVSTKDVQAALQKAGYYSGNVDGKIGAQTIEAIKQLQKDNNLKVDGIVGANTWAKLQDVSNPTVASGTIITAE